MSKKFAVFDIDGTLFRWQLYHELFDAFIENDIITSRNAEYVLSAREEWKTRAESYTRYEFKLIDEVERAIVGISESTLHSIADEILKAKGGQIYRYTSRLLKTLNRQDYTTIALSASHHELVERFCVLHGIDIAYGRKYTIEAGKVTEKSILVHDRKSEILQQLVRDNKLTFEGSYAVGDSSSDIGMLELVDHPVAFNPNKELLETAMKRGWKIVVERKNIAYTLQKGTDGPFILAETDSF